MRFSASPSWMQYSLCAIWLLKSQNYSFSSPDLFQKLLLNKWWMYLFKCLQQQIYLLVPRIACDSPRENKNSSFILVDEDVKCRKADTLNHCDSKSKYPVFELSGSLLFQHFQFFSLVIIFITEQRK